MMIKNFYDFFMNLQHVIPCEKCKTHYKQNIQKYDLNNSLGSRQDLVKWLIDLHNDINKDNGKPILDHIQMFIINIKICINLIIL